MWSQNPLKIVYAAEEQRPQGFKGKRISRMKASIVEQGYDCHHKLIMALAGAPGKHLIYGQSTLLGHQLAGEERFGLEWHAADDSVW